VFALFTGDVDDQEDAASARDVSQLSEQVDALEDQLQSLTDAQDQQAAEVNRLTTELDELDRAVSEVRSASRQPADELDSLQTRVDGLEQRLDDIDSSSTSSDRAAEDASSP
jgi:chromosome segregation ATPase